MNLKRSQFAIQDKNSTDLENEKDGFVYAPVTNAYTSGNMNGSSNRKGL